MADNNIAQFPQRRPQPFEIVYPTNWEGHEPEPVRWLVKNCIPRGTVCLFSGDSGLGKSLLIQQLQTCTAIGAPWLGFDVERCKSFGFYCEDPMNVLQLRQADICRFYNVAHSDLDDMSLVSRIGMENTLMDFNQRSSAGRTTAVYDQLANHVRDFGAQLIIVDTLAHTFNGNENIRVQVTQFVAALQRIATEMDGAVVLNSHPSVSSMASGTGYSGSTAWRATVRAHMYLKRPKGYDDEDESSDNDARLLKTMKANWGPGGGLVRMRWQDGVFVGAASAAIDRKPVTDMMGKYEIDKAVFDAIKYIVEHGDKIAAGHTARNCAEQVLPRLPSCRIYTRHDIGIAVDRLLESGKIEMTTFGPPSRSFTYLRPSNWRYPGEGNQSAHPSGTKNEVRNDPKDDAEEGVRSPFVAPSQLL